jgi:hypothetical protein
MDYCLQKSIRHGAWRRLDYVSLSACNTFGY